MEATTTGYYSRELTMPKDMNEGLCNFLQLIVNQLDGAPMGTDAYKALMIAVDLVSDLRSKSNPYENALTPKALTVAAVQKELQAKREAELVKSKELWFAAGRDSMKAEILSKLGLAA